MFLISLIVNFQLYTRGHRDHSVDACTNPVYTGLKKTSKPTRIETTINIKPWRYRQAQEYRD